MQISLKKIKSELIYDGPKDSFIAIVLVYQCSYFLFDYSSHNFFHYVGPFEKLGFSTWEPMAGASIVLLYYFKTPFLPFAILCPVVSEIIFHNEKLNIFTLLTSEVISALAYITASYTLNNYSNFDPRFRKVKDVVNFLAVAIFITLINTSLSMKPIFSEGFIQSELLFPACWRLFVGELSGILSTAPLLFLIIYNQSWSHPNNAYFVQLIVLLFVLSIIFWYPNASVFQLFYLLFIPSIWIALTSTSLFSALSLLFVQLISLVGSEVRFGSDVGRGSVQSMIIALAFTILVVSAVVSEKEDAAKRLRDQEAALNRAMRVKSTGETASLIAHEINQPLTALNTYVEVAQASLNDEGNILGRIRKEVERITLIIRSVRSLVKKDKVIFSTNYADDICKDISDVLDREAKRAQSDLMINNYAPGTAIHGDIFQIQQAIINLVTNSADALLANKKKGVIKITLLKGSSSQLCIEVEDNGPGFPAHINLESRQAFISSKPTGTGLGLSIVNSIAEIHGGSFEIDSSRLRTITTIKLPIII